jgi:hypothetical protein
MHMVVARELAPSVLRGAVQNELGAYYLGATTPDIRALAKWDRSATHFFDLSNFDEQSGVTGVFQSHPKLAASGELSSETAAFVCGYISHLEMDEAWIEEVYRPCFGERSPLKGELLAGLLDRVLQFELDRAARQDEGALAEIRRQLMATAVEQIDSFIDNETLARWRDLNSDLLCQQPDWERFRANVSRHLKAFGVESEADVAHLVDNIPDLLDQSVRQVTPERLGAFQERSRQRAANAIREYLS